MKTETEQKVKKSGIEKRKTKMSGKIEENRREN